MSFPRQPAPLRDGALGLRAAPALIRAIADERPDAVALESGERRMTYGELHRRASQLAALLKVRGVRRGDVVGVHLPRSIEHVVAALAVMMCRACFLPLDPAWPAGRAKDLLIDSNATAVIGRSGELSAICGPMLRIMQVDEAEIDTDDSAPVGLLDDPGPDDLAYIIYTSGSTGAPKGVEIAWRSFLHFMAWRWSAFNMSPSDRVSWLASVGFDAAIADVWPTLTAGGTVVVLDDSARMSADALQEALVENRVTIAGFVPPVLAEQLIVRDWPARTAVQLMMSAGEALRTYPAQGLPFVLLNGYGPSECTIETTVGIISAAPPNAEAPPIGRPIAGVFVYLLDESGRPVPSGEVGEIYIGGANVGQGYRNRPALTGRRFLPDPFHPGGRMYRTGDLGMQLPDGQFAFRGRTDDQVQIRGHRVEPGEVASVLAQHPQVASCAVVSRDGPHGAELVAYLAPAKGAALSAAALRDFLGARLPAYMLPGAYVALDALPLNASGKVDKRALPAPDPGNTLLQAPYRAPDGPAEERLAAIFAEVLTRNAVGTDDDFFLMGGQSLLAAQVALKAGQAFGVELRPNIVFEAPTVARLADAIEQVLVSSLRFRGEAGRGAPDRIQES